MVANNNEFWNFDYNEDLSKQSGSSNELDKKFNEKKLDEFKEQMAQIEKDVDPRFLDMFKEYEQKVSNLLSENLSVVASRVVQEELTKQNTRIQMKFNADSMKIEDAYTKMFGWTSDNNSYWNDDLAA